MEISVRLPGPLRPSAGGQSVVAVDLGDAATVADLLETLARTYPDLDRRLRDELGAVRRHVNVFVGAEEIRRLAGTATVLAPGDEVSVIPAISGGFVPVEI